MEKQLLFLVLLVASCNALVQDMTGKQFTFTNGVSHPHVILLSNITKISAMTMCQRFFADVRREYVIFSVAIRGNSNAILLTRPSAGVYKAHLGASELVFAALPEMRNGWKSLCWTWDGATGLTQLWLNGKHTSHRYMTKAPVVNSKPLIMLGQEQDSYGGGFDKQQGFEGQITDFHFWDSVLSDCEIGSYMRVGSVGPGNILNWKALMYENMGNVIVHDSDFNSKCSNK